MEESSNAIDNSPKHSKTEQIKELFFIKSYPRILIYIISHAFIGIMPIMIMPAFGGRWFSGCDDNDDDCLYNYTEYNFYNSLFGSTRGAIKFLFAGFVGSLSDLYGRKRFLLIATILSFINYALMSFHANIWIYWTITTLIFGLFGSTQLLSYIEIAYIADIVSLDQKTMGFAIAHGFMSASIAIGTVAAPIIAAIWNISVVFLFMTIFYLLLSIYVIIFLKESVMSSNTEGNRKTKSICKHWNVFRPLFYINSNPIILYVTLVQVLCSVINNTLSIVIVYLNDQMNINDDNQSNLVNLSMYLTLSVSSVIIAGIIMPCFKSKFEFATDINLVCIGLIWLILYCLTMSSIAFITDDTGNNDDLMVYCYSIIIISNIFNSGLAFFIPAISGIVSTYINDKEQGMAFGIVEAYQGVTTIITRFTFGYGYNFSKNEIKFPSLMFYIMSGLLSIALLISMGPLKRTINRLNKTGQQLSIRKRNDEDKMLLLEKIPKRTK